MAKEDATGQAVESSMEQLQDINRKQSEIISAVPCRTTQRSLDTCKYSFLIMCIYSYLLQKYGLFSDNQLLIKSFFTCCIVDTAFPVSFATFRIE